MNQDEINKIELQKQIQEIENIAKQYLNKDALARYGSLKTAFPDKATKVATLIIQLINNNQIIDKLNDEEFKVLLKQLNERKDFRIIK